MGLNAGVGKAGGLQYNGAPGYKAGEGLCAHMWSQKHTDTLGHVRAHTWHYSCMHILGHRRTHRHLCLYKGQEAALNLFLETSETKNLKTKQSPPQRESRLT